MVSFEQEKNITQCIVFMSFSEKEGEECLFHSMPSEAKGLMIRAYLSPKRNYERWRSESYGTVGFFVFVDKSGNSVGKVQAENIVLAIFTDVKW